MQHCSVFNHGTNWENSEASNLCRYERRFQVVEPFYNGQARVQRFDGAWEVIGEQGEPLVLLAEAQGERGDAFAELSGDLVGFWKTQTLCAAVELGVLLDTKDDLCDLF